MSMNPLRNTRPVRTGSHDRLLVAEKRRILMNFEIDTERAARITKTAKLRGLRLAKEAAEKPAGEATPPETPDIKRTA
jgi:hypothetical protein